MSNTTPVKWTSAGLTPAGNALQAELLNTGVGLTFTRAVAADADGTERLQLTLQAGRTVTGPKFRLPVLLANTGVTESFTMTELRFYVKRLVAGIPSGDEVLYATATDETGDAIPTAASAPGFTIDWAFIFQFGNASDVEVTLDPAGLVSWGMVGEANGVAPLNEDGIVPDDHLPDYIPMSQKGVAGGVATLGEDGKVPSANLGALGGSRLEITFDESFEGLPYTIAGGEESYSGTVPESLEAVHSLLAVDTDYTLTVTDAAEDETYTRTVHTDDWYTALAVSIAPFAATITVNCPAGSTVKCANGGTELQQTATSGTAVFTVGNAGTWTVTATLGDDSASGEVVISASGESKSITLSYFSSTITVNCPAGSSVTCEKGDDTETKTATGGTAVFTVTSAGTWEITATLDGETATGEVVISASGEQKTITLAYVHIYGVLWDGTSSTVLSRTNDAQDFTDPVPAVNNGNGSSPFDTLQPWAGMTRETDSAAGELVKIPKYWYKWTKSGNTVALQIADKEVEGFSVSPAHCDRGDGHGERDVVYVGRYHCHTSNWKSQTGGKPKADITRSAARSGIRNLGGTIWQWDWAMSWTIKMLYLVEYADWNSQAKIGYGCGNSSATENMGATDGMTYHTGTSKANRTTYGVGVQYRHIEGLWDNVYDWVDGCYYSSAGLNIILNPSNFSDSSGGTSIGTPSSGYPSALDVKTALSGMWIIPTAASGSDSTYVPDGWYFNAGNPCLFLGGGYNQYQDLGLFCVYYSTASYSSSNIGSRLMKLP